MEENCNCGPSGIAEVEGEDWLGGCIPFTGPEKIKPEGSIIASPELGVLDLVRNFVIIEDGEVKTIRPADMTGHEKILAVEPNEAAIKILDTTFQGRGILIKNFDGELKTYDEWPEGFAAWAIQATRAGSGITVLKPAGKKPRGVQTLPRAGIKPLQLSRLARFQEG